MNRNQQKTGKIARDLIIEFLDTCTGEDEDNQRIMSACEGNKLDTSALDTELLLNDPKVKRAFKKFVDGIIGSLQFVEEEFEADDCV